MKPNKIEFWYSYKLNNDVERIIVRDARPPDFSAFHSIPSRGFPEETPSSNQFNGSPRLLAPSSAHVLLLFSLFPSFLQCALLSPVVGSILCRVQLDWTQITYRRFRFTSGRGREGQRYMSRDGLQWRNGLGQQQFNLSNLSAREHLPQFRQRPEFFYYRVSAANVGCEFRVRLVTSIVRVELFERERQAAVYLESYPGSFIVSGERDIFYVTAWDRRLSKVLSTEKSR